MKCVPFLFVVLGAVACDGPTEPPIPTVVVRMDNPSYPLALADEWAFGDVTFTITNVGIRTRWVTPYGHPLFLQRLDEGHWRTVWNPAYAGGFGDPIPLARHEQRTFTVTLIVEESRESPGFEHPPEVGTYRLVLGSVFLNRGGARSGGALVPVEDRRSDPFTLVVTH